MTRPMPKKSICTLPGLSKAQTVHT
jgi:hypothetical protein